MNMSNNKIPKIIHYCWFGNNELSEEARKCIQSWKEFFPDYEIKEWNESNYDLEVCDYVKEAYKLKKWAFVSDYARFDILYKYGGIYFDTDVEVIKPMDDIVRSGAFMGLESGTIESVGRVGEGYVAPGLGIGAPAGLDFYNDILSLYDKRHFIGENGKADISETVCHITTELFQKKGISISDNTAISSGIKIYPKDYFCPKDYETEVINLTENSRSIHHYSASWVPFYVKKISKIEKAYKKKYGKDLGLKKSKKATLIYKVIARIDEDGFLETLKFALKKFIGD